MKPSTLVAFFVLLASTASFAQKCPTIDKTMLDKGFHEVAPWRVVSGGPGECSFMAAKTSSINLGFNHMVMSSAEAAAAAVTDMRKAVAGTSVIEPMPSLGELGFSYQPKKENGQVDRTSMFFYGHRGNVNVSGYFNLKDPITPDQRVLAGNLIAGTMGVATNPKLLAKEANCRYLDPNLVKRLLPAGDTASIVPDANNCVVSAGGSVITVAVAKDARGWPAAERILKEGGCTVDTVPNLGKGAGIAYRCSRGNPRAEVGFVTGSRMVRILFAPVSEPSAEDRATLVELARFAARN